MRQTAIPGAVVGALNELFDKHPIAMTALLEHRERLDSSVEEKYQDSDGGSQPPTLGLLDVINAIAGALELEADINTVHSLDGLEGFILGRKRRRVQEPSMGDMVAEVILNRDE